MAMFKREERNWVEYRELPKLLEIDFHPDDQDQEFADLPYHEKLQQWNELTLNALHRAQMEGRQWVLFKHGHSTSHIGKKTARSVVRGVMRSKKATPFIVRRESIQQPSVFLAAIRPRV
jgi:hypothetical protein